MNKKEKRTPDWRPLSSSPVSFTDSWSCQYLDSTTQDITCQTFDSGIEVKEKFEPKKNQALKLSESFQRLGLESRSRRVAECGSFLSFAHAINASGTIDSKGILYSANFCRDKLCPMCSWRRTYKVYAQASKILDVISKDYKFLFVTLTIPNVSGSDLSCAITDMNNAWHRFISYKKIMDINKGFWRTLEVTHNKSKDSYHPHFHVIFAVPKSYFKSEKYVKRATWLELWQRAMRDDSITQVDVRTFKDKNVNSLTADSLTKAVKEVAKYTVKPNDYLFDDIGMTDKVVSVYSSALAGRRMLSLGGIFKSTFQALKMEDIESDSVDLIHTDDEQINAALSYLILEYGWSSGCYSVTSKEIVSAAALRRSPSLSAKRSLSPSAS